MTDISICPICGKEMTVVGNTTKHYECLECNKDRERVAKEICGEALFSCAFGCEGLCEDCYGIADYVLKEVALAEARGMKKAAEEIVSRYVDDKYLLNKSKIMFDMVGIATEIITTANKTLEAEGDSNG